MFIQVVDKKNFIYLVLSNQTKAAALVRISETLPGTTITKTRWTGTNMQATQTEQVDMLRNSN